MSEFVGLSADQARDLAVTRALQAEQAANNRAKFLKEIVGREAAKRLHVRTTNLSYEDYVDSIAQERIGKDPIWKKHVARNQWMTQYAIMFGQQATAEAINRLNDNITRSHLNGA